MKIRKSVREYVQLGYTQVAGYLEILLLKLRIFGFADKRGILIAKLGDTLYKSYKAKELEFSDESVIKIIGEIEESEKEIETAEEKINRRWERAKNDYSDFKIPVEPIHHEIPQPNTVADPETKAESVDVGLNDPTPIESDAVGKPDADINRESSP